MNLFLISGNFENYSFGDGLVVAVTGILTVLFILALISLCISLVAKIIYAAEHKGEKQILRKPAQPAAIRETVVTPIVETESSVDDKTDDKELVAVITAAIAASLNTTSDRLVVRSFRRSSNWQKEAMHEQRQHTLI